MICQAADRMVERHDVDLERRVRNYLVGRHLPGLRRIEVEAQDGVVTITGRVHTYYEKQLCLACCARVAGVLQLVDQVKVVYPPIERSRPV